MARLYLVQNSAAVTTAAPVSQPTGTSIRTMLQIGSTASSDLTIVEWGVSFDGTTVTSPGKVELFGTTVSATMSTAAVAADIVKYSDPNSVASVGIDVGSTAKTGFATAAVTEGTVANSRMFDMQLISPTGSYVKQWPLGREPKIAASQFIRVRVTFGTTVNMFAYVIVEE